MNRFQSAFVLRNVRQAVGEFDSLDARINASGGGSPSWSSVTGKPSTFPPEAHSHVIADTTGLQTALDGKQAAGSYAAATHTHAIADVTGLQTALDAKAGAISTASAVLANDVQMPTSNAWVTAVSITPAAGTWLVVAQITMRRAATTARRYGARIFNGTATEASGEAYVASANPSGATIALHAIVTTAGSTTYTLQGRTTAGAATENIKAQAEGSQDGATHIKAARLG